MRDAQAPKKPPPLLRQLLLIVVGAVIAAFLSPLFLLFLLEGVERGF